MKILNIEIKARVNDLVEIEEKLLKLNADFKGIDYQTDTYFNVNKGRLKLRQGNIENSLIFYNRKETLSLKKSEIDLQKLPADNKALLTILSKTLGVAKIVTKSRKIYFIENVKIHLDYLEKLGYFIEIEAIDNNLTLGEKFLSEQCNYYVNLFGINPKNFIDKSYSDMI